MILLIQIFALQIQNMNNPAEGLANAAAQQAAENASPFFPAIIGVFFAIAVIFSLRFYFRSATRLDKGLKKKIFLILLPRWTATDQSAKETMTKEELMSEISKMENVFSQIGGLWPERGIRTFFRGREDDISFEIVADKNKISFYVAIPPKYAVQIERNLHAQYPHAHIEEVEDYNIFYPTGTVLGTELALNKSSIFPILTYKTLDGDPLSGLTNALSKLEEPNGAAIQILVRSARPYWHVLGKRVAREMQQGKKLEEAMSMQERVYGKSYLFQPTVAATYRILGDFRQKRGEFVKADQAYQKAIAVNQAIYQTDVHPYLADLYDLRSEVLFAQGKIALGNKMKREAQKIQELLKQSA